MCCAAHLLTQPGLGKCWFWRCWQQVLGEDDGGLGEVMDQKNQWAPTALIAVIVNMLGGGA